MKNEFLKFRSGRVGNLLIYMRCGRICMRTLTESRASIGEKQAEQQERVAAVAILYKAEGDAGLKGYWSAAKRPEGWSGYNLFVQRNLPAFTGRGEIGDFGKLALTAGELPLPDELRVRADGEAWAVEWENPALYPGSREDDRLCVALMKGKRCFNVRLPDCGGARRRDGKAVFRIPEEWRGYTHAFCFMCSADRGKASPSRYLGQLEAVV